MEFLPGKTLRDHISSGPLESGAVLDIGFQIADALDSAHAQGAIHRDIKPENIFLTPRGQIKILSSASARRLIPAPARSAMKPSSRSKTSDVPSTTWKPAATLTPHVWLTTALVGARCRGQS
jgi:serine/threonine protein kinase